jgi:hypothetical protein
MIVLSNHMRTSLRTFMRRMTMKLLQGARDGGLQSPFGDDFIVYLVDDTPMSIAEAFASPDADDWKEAVQNEIN